MAHGVKPYGRTEAQNTIFSVQDMGELACRLDSILTHDRRGDVVWLEDFESKMVNWDALVIGAASTVTLDHEHARSGITSILLTTDTNANDYAAIRCRHAHKRPSPLGYEFSFAYTGTGQCIFIDVTWNDGVAQWAGGLRWVQATGDIEYYNNLGGWTNIGNRLLVPSSILFHTIKLVMDLNTHQYSRCILNEFNFNMAGIPLWTMGFPGNQGHSVYIYNYNLTSVAKTYARIDDFIHTQNEP